MTIRIKLFFNKISKRHGSDDDDGDDLFCYLQAEN